MADGRKSEARNLVLLLMNSPYAKYEMTIKEWILGLVEKGLSEEEVLKELLKGNAMKGMKAMKAPFHKLNYNKVVNPKPKKVKKDVQD